MNKETEELNSKEKEARFNMMAIPNPRAYIIAPEKVQEFKNVKPSPEVIKRNEEIAQKFKINNLTQTEEPKKRIKTRTE